MESLSLLVLVSVFGAGLLTFLAPCTLPLVPAFLAFIAGVSRGDSSRDGRARILKNSVAFVCGFTVVFITFGILLGLLGTYFGPLRTFLGQFGGLIVILFGLSMLNIIHFPVFRTYGGFQFPRFLTPGNMGSSALVGGLFALGWTPCIGPLLASVLLLVTALGTVFEGILLLLVFSLGLGIPFIITALSINSASQKFKILTTYAGGIRTVGALFLIGIGIILLTGNFGLLLQYGYTVFNALGLEALFNYF